MATPIGIRAEDKNRWERRAPLTPDHVRGLISEQGLEVVVEPSPRRAFPDPAYAAAGARLDADFSDCDVILGVKEIPVEKLEAGKTYLFFSHVIKGQPANMPLLRRILELGVTLLDYERIVDPRGRRVIFFGRHAGYAGMIDTLWALGQRFAAEGSVTPLEQIRRAHQYGSLEEALNHLARLGEAIRSFGFPAPRRPIVCGFTGSGNVARGAMEVYERLPIVDIDPEVLLELSEDRERPRNLLYRCAFDRSHRYRRSADGGHDAAELVEHPERYESGLTEYLPHLTALVHGAYWEPNHPRVISRVQLAELFAREPQPKLRVIGDLSCDVDGGIEATVRATTPGEPVFLYDPLSGVSTGNGVEGRGVVIMAVDNLPCELPVEASHHFGDSLVRFVARLARTEWSRPLAELDLPSDLAGAVVAHRGELTPPYRYLERALAESR